MKDAVKKNEIVVLIACAVLYLLLHLWGQRGQAINGLFDEGVHLGLMQLLAEGKGQLYRDFLFVHPPGVIWAGAWLWPRVGGDVFVLRALFILFCGLAYPPFYLIVRQICGVRTALATLLLMTITPAFSGWLGRTIMLDLGMHVPLTWALWLLICVPGRRPLIPLCAGLLCGLGGLIKATVLPAALLIAFALALCTLFDRQKAPEEKPQNRWDSLWFTASFLLTYAVLTLWLSRIPHYVEYGFGLNGLTPYVSSKRLYELTNGFYQLPFALTFGTLGIVWMVRQSKSRELRFLALFALFNAVAMLLLPKHFFWRYLMPSMPIFTLGVVLWWQEVWQKSSSHLLRRTAGVFAVLFGLVNLVTMVLYWTHESQIPSGHQEALAVLRNSPGPLFTLDPIWAVASGQTLPVWPFACDAEWRVAHVPVPQSFDSALLRCPTAILGHHNGWLPPETKRLLRKRYRTVYRHKKPEDKDYVEILRRNDAEVDQR